MNFDEAFKNSFDSEVFDSSLQDFQSSPEYDSSNFSDIESRGSDLPEQGLTESSVDKCEKVERYILSMIASGHVDSLLYLCGEIPNSKRIKQSSELFYNFNHYYRASVDENPAIKWYAKLLRKDPECIKVSGDTVNLKMTTKAFKEVFKAGFSDFDVSVSYSSPIVDLVISKKRKIEEGQTSKGKKARTEVKYKYQVDASESSDVRSIEFSDLQMSEAVSDTDYELANQIQDEFYAQNSLRVDDDKIDTKDNNVIDISFNDLASKTIAEYLVDLGLTDRESISSKLRAEKISNNRIHEIIGIVAYLTSKQRLEGLKPKKVNKDSAGTEFDFEL